METIYAEQIRNFINGKYQTYNFNDREVLDALTLEIIQSNATLKFHKCIFFHPVIIVCKSENITLDFSDATFHSSLIIKGVYPFEIKFPKARLANETIIDSKRGANLDFDYSTIEGSLTIENANELRIRMHQADFVNRSLFSFTKNHVVYATFEGAKFRVVDFSDTSFESNVSFKSTQFFGIEPNTTCCFKNVTLKADLFFEGAELTLDFDFTNIKISGLTRFNNVVAEESLLNFSQAVFSKKAFFNNSKFAGLKMSDVEFWELPVFSKVYVGNLNLSGAMLAKGSDFFESKILSANRETFRIIKNEFLKINNTVEALHYRRLEMDEYQKEITKHGSLSEKCLLHLNKLSNNHGISWLQGCKFTLFVSLVAFFFYIISLGKHPFTWGWQGYDSFNVAVQTTTKFYVHFLLVTHRIDFMEEFHPSGLSYIIDFIGRIFIGYGIYQTIQAFRKYGKN